MMFSHAELYGYLLNRLDKLMTSAFALKLSAFLIIRRYYYAVVIGSDISCGTFRSGVI